MRDITEMMNCFSHEINNVPYNGINPVVGHIAIRRYYSSIFRYKISNVDWNAGIITLDKLETNGSSQIVYAKFQTRGKKDKGQFCFATMENGKLHCWGQKDVAAKNGHIIIITNEEI